MTKASKLDRVVEHGTLDGETLFMPILMHFAARQAGISYAEFARDHTARVRANLVCLERFDVDCVTLMSDPYGETSAFGARIEYRDEAVPRCLDLLVKDAQDILELPIPDVYEAERTLDRLRGAELYQRELQGTVPVIGWVEGPLAEACDLAGMGEMMMMLMMDPGSAKRLMDKVMTFAKAFATAQVDAGCDIVGIGDAVCSQIDRATYDAFVKDRHLELVDHIHGAGARVKFHVCGDTTHLLPSFAGLGLDLVDLDWQVDLIGAREALGDHAVITGNLDPSLVLSRDADTVRNMARQLVERHADSRYVLAGGCEIGVDTPPGNLAAMRSAAGRSG